MKSTLKVLAVAMCATCGALVASCSPRPLLTMSEGGPSQCQLSPDECLEFVWLGDLNLWMGKQEMTAGQLRCLFPSSKDQHQDYYAKDWDKETSPAVNVSWKQAQQACRALNRKCAKQLPRGCVFRLPTEGEWEAAAKCGSDAQGFTARQPRPGRHVWLWHARPQSTRHGPGLRPCDADR